MPGVAFEMRCGPQTKAKVAQYLASLAVDHVELVSWHFVRSMQLEPEQFKRELYISLKLWNRHRQ